MSRQLKMKSPVPRRTWRGHNSRQYQRRGWRLRLKTVLCGIMFFGAHICVAQGVSAADSAARRGELGVQIGVRWLDRDIVPDGDTGLDSSWGVHGAWKLNARWALFADVNTSTHASKELCVGAEFCSALTPEVTLKVVTIGFERRMKPGPKGGSWLVGVGSGMMDLEWNGIQVHHGIFSLNFGRRMPLGPGALRMVVRTESGFSGHTDNQLEGTFDHARITNLLLVVGWGFGFGGTF